MSDLTKILITEQSLQSLWLNDIHRAKLKEQSNTRTCKNELVVASYYYLHSQLKFKISLIIKLKE